MNRKQYPKYGILIPKGREPAVHAKVARCEGCGVRVEAGRYCEPCAITLAGGTAPARIQDPQQIAQEAGIKFPRTSRRSRAAKTRRTSETSETPRMKADRRARVQGMPSGARKLYGNPMPQARSGRPREVSEPVTEAPKPRKNHPAATRVIPTAIESDRRKH
jgi:transposase